MRILRGQVPPDVTPVPTPVSSQTYYQAGNRLYLEGQYLLAKPYYEAVVKEDPTNWKAYQALAGCDYRIGLKAEALKNYQKSLDNNPNNPDIQDFMKTIASQQSSAANGPNAAPAMNAPMPSS